MEGNWTVSHLNSRYLTLTVIAVIYSHSLCLKESLFILVRLHLVCDLTGADGGGGTGPAFHGDEVLFWAKCTTRLVHYYY